MSFLCPVMVRPLTLRPLQVAGTVAIPVDLSGTWKFLPGLPADISAVTADLADEWKNIQVPGEWVMQGFTVTPESPAAYFRTFNLDRVKDRRIKLRFSAVYSWCQIWVNGVSVGSHEGGFVPFECDITDAARPGVNTLLVSVQSESQLDRLACGSQYAGHPLGGISRKVQLFSVPAVHLAGLTITTTFDAGFCNAVATAEFVVRNQSSGPSSGTVTLAIAAAEGSGAPLVTKDAVWVDLAPGEERKVIVNLPVSNPGKWDSEHPQLHALTLVAKDNAGDAMRAKATFGFRQVEVRGQRVLVNGSALKLFGVCRHETHPLLGRSLTPELWRLDAERFRDGNCNFIRTSHYPPAEEFLAECDRLGLFVELEAPLCWVGTATPQDEAVFRRLAQANLETVHGYPNHPAVIIRSLANESAWSPLFAQVHELVRQADPTLPTTFHDQCWGPDNNHGSTELPIAVNHYPGPTGATDAAQMTRPVLFGEYCHLNAYNRRELLTDPSLRELWGAGLEMMHELMYQAPTVLGGSLWAAIDDTFFLPSGETVGYGTWGPIDGWRRPKPEYWHMRKIFSPLRLLTRSLPQPVRGRPLMIAIENRHNFTDLAEICFTWKRGAQSGSVKVTAPAGGVGNLEIPVEEPKPEGELLELKAISPRGFVVDEWQIELGHRTPEVSLQPAPTTGAVSLVETAQSFIIHGPDFSLSVDSKTGGMTASKGDKGEILTRGPELFILPLNPDNGGSVQMTGPTGDITPFSDSCSDWKLSGISARVSAGEVELQIAGAYREATGGFTLHVGRGGAMTVNYRFTILEGTSIDPRQIGVGFGLPLTCQTLSWRRRARWSFYPADHIGRPTGTTRAFAPSTETPGLAGPRTPPTRPWSEDASVHGTNDFRSTKMNILEAALLSESGKGIRIISAGRQHVRAWVNERDVGLLIADYANEGAEAYFKEQVIPRHPLKGGDVVAGTVRLELAG